MSKANEVQHGGSHYQGTDQQHWDMVFLLGCNYFLSVATKYVDRLGKKDHPVTELRKAKHMLEKYTELVTDGQIPKAELADNPGDFAQFALWTVQRGYSAFQTSFWILLMADGVQEAMGLIDDEIASLLAQEPGATYVNPD